MLGRRPRQTIEHVDHRVVKDRPGILTRKAQGKLGDRRCSRESTDIVSEPASAGKVGRGKPAALAVALKNLEARVTL